MFKVLASRTWFSKKMNVSSDIQNNRRIYWLSCQNLRYFQLTDCKFFVYIHRQNISMWVKQINIILELIARIVSHLSNFQVLMICFSIVHRQILLKWNSCDWVSNGAYPTSAPGSSSKFLVESEMLVYFRICVCIVSVILCSMFLVVYICLFSMSGFCSWIAFFWFPRKYRFPWLLFQEKALFSQISCEFGHQFYLLKPS